MAASPSSPATGRSGPALALAGLAALLASSCCVLPLVLVLLGISGSWISRLRVLEPYSNALILLSLAALALAAWQIYRPARRAGQACASDDAACQVTRAGARRWFWWVALLAAIPLLVPLVAPLFY